METLISQCYLSLDGSPASAALMRDLEQVTVENSLHLPDVTTLVLHDPHLAWVDSDLLLPGVSLLITARAGQATQPLFDGEIVEIEVDFAQGAPRLLVRAFDRLHRLARGHQTRSFVNVTDADLVRTLAEEVGLAAQVDPEGQLHAYIFQQNESNLAFLQRRAAALGSLLYVKGLTLHCETARSGDAPIMLAWGASLSEFRPRLTTIDQFSSVMVRGWDPAAKHAVVGEAKVPTGTPQIGTATNGGQFVGQAFRIEARNLIASGPVRSQAAAETLAQAFADRHGGRFVEAEGTAVGNPALIAGATVEIRSVGQRFSGSYFVTTASHSFSSDDGYRTSFSVSGLNATNLLALLDNTAPDSMSNPGLVVGIVTDNQDPDQLGRVRVTFPWLTEDHASNWARVASPGAGNERGLLLLPEINDEVLVGFEQGDIHQPYVLGGLWNGIDMLPTGGGNLLGGGNVVLRLIRSRTGHQIGIAEQASGTGEIHLRMASGREFVISDDKQGVTIKTDRHEISLDDGGNVLRMHSDGDLNITASGSVSIKGTAGVQLASSGPLSVDSQATLTIKGLLVKIN